MTSGRRGGNLAWRVGEARLDTWQVMRAHVKGLLVEALVQVLDVVMMVVLLEALVKVMVKVFVVKVEEVLLFSLSSTPFPRTRPAARVWAWGAKGPGFPIVLPAPGRRCSGPFS